MRKLTTELLYWLIVLTAYWIMTYDGPPIRIAVWWYVHKTCKTVAYGTGRLGLVAEKRYLDGMEKITTC